MGTPPPVDRQIDGWTDTCQNITFPRTTYTGGNKKIKKALTVYNFSIQWPLLVKDKKCWLWSETRFEGTLNVKEPLMQKHHMWGSATERLGNCVFSPGLCDQECHLLLFTFDTMEFFVLHFPPKISTHPIHQSYQQNLRWSRHVHDSSSPWLAGKIWWSVIEKKYFPQSLPPNKNHLGQNARYGLLSYP